MKIHLQWRNRASAPRVMRWAERFLILVACLCLGFCALVYFEARVYQDYESRQLEKFRAKAPAGALLPKPTRIPRAEIPDGEPLSMMKIPRVGVSVVVVEGVRPRSLRRAVGHIPGTALPGEAGNVGIAGHRDTFFRPLSEIRGDDVITLIASGVSYEYSVESIQIVDPSDVQVLNPSNEPVLTLVTCYPFYFAGPAPQRYIVRARQISMRPQ